MYTISPEYPRNPRFVFAFSAANKRGCSWMLWILAGKVFLLLLRMVSKAPTSMLLHLDSQSWQLKMKSFFATLDRFLLCKCEVMRWAAKVIEEPDKWSCHGLNDAPRAYSQIVLNTPQIGSVAPKHTMLLDSGAPFNVSLQGPFAWNAEYWRTCEVMQ